MEALRLSTLPPRAPNLSHSPLLSPLHDPRLPLLRITRGTGAKPKLHCAVSRKPIDPASALDLDTRPASEEVEEEEEARAGGEEFDWRAQWYPVAPVCDLDKRAPHGKRVLGLDVVVWWDKAEERWRVFEDRCPHRLAPLSEGRIDRWGRLQCVYHGWCFDGSGGCKYIPQAPPDGPPVMLTERWTPEEMTKIK